MFASIINRVRQLFNDESGPTAVEYAVMLALVVGVVLGTVSSVGTASISTFQSASSALDTGGGGKIDGNENGNGQI